MSLTHSSPAEAAAAVAAGKGVLLDVRTPGEFREVHAEGALLVSLDVLDSAKAEAARGESSRLLYVLCGSGIRAVRAAEILRRAGLDNIHVVEGGTNAWVAAGLPVVRGRKTISIERQVRIGAGLLVLTGVLLGHFTHPYFYLISGFVGSGLIFAGVTDICGMAIVLARAPWNRSQPASCRSDG